jgi:hypothetical protein
MSVFWQCDQGYRDGRRRALLVRRIDVGWMLRDDESGWLQV